MMLELFILFLMAYIYLKEFNPLKLGMMIFIFSILMFYFMKMMMFNSFIPMLFILLFSGGIIIMFLMFSSLMPNMKMPKIMFIPISMIFILFFNKMNFLTSCFVSLEEVKYIFLDTMLIFMVFFIFIYFFSFIFFLSKDTLSLRAFFYYSMFNFVN